MTRALAFAVAVLALAGPAQAQVTVVVVLGQTQALPGERLPVAVRVTNFSGHSLELGQDDDWLQLSVETAQGLLAGRRGTIPVAGAFRLENAKVATKRLELTPYFDIDHPGRYVLRASVRIPGWDQEVRSPPVSFDIVRGSTVWEQDFGIPAAAGRDVRRYALIQAHHLKEAKLYVRVTEPATGLIYAIYPLGPVLGFSESEKQIDRASQLHVLAQTGARSFTYSVVDPAGRLVVRQTHEIATTRPTLRMDGEGKITVNGGQRRQAQDDLPAVTPVGAPPPADPKP
jgi:hypothetical protein